MMRRSPFRLSTLGSSIFLVLLFSYIISNAQSKATIKGVVTDSKSESSLPGANIIVMGTKIGASSDIDGKYSLSLSPGTYEIEASYVGYKSAHFHVKVTAGQNVVHDFKLSPDIIGTDEIVIVGSRASERTVIQSSVPIDVITQKEIEKTGFTQTTQVLQMLVPSYNAPHPTITDGSDHMRPATLRGLGPDQVLVLVNGKRRHTSALVHVNGSVGRGSTGADLNAIPLSAIERIEVLRDGAAAQYGSDAISGVINIILKAKEGLDASVTYGQYLSSAERGYLETEGNIPGETSATYSWDGKKENISYTDGKSVNAHLGYGFKIFGGNFYLSGQLRNQDPTNRAGLDQRQQYFALANGQPDPREATIDRINHKIGEAQLKDLSTFLNGTAQISEDMQFYLFGGFSNRKGLSGGFWRRALDDRDVRAIYPDGFLPEIKSDINDFSASAGVKGSLGNWAYDLSETFGSNSFNFGVTNSVNTSLGASSQTEFDAGTLKFKQSTTNLDFVRQVDIGTATPLNIAVGAEFRWENYQIVAGEAASYIDGGVTILDGPNKGKAAPAGAQVFPGFSPKNTQDQGRTNLGLYLDFENKPVADLLVSAAARYENYSDFGSTLTGKFTTRYEFIDGFALRGAVSTGFRAPSLAQEFYSAISTNFINGVPFEIGTFPVSSSTAQALGAIDLKAEKSVNISGGFTASVNNFSFTADLYQISITDRIVLTENFTGTGITNFLKAKGINASGGRFFTNALSTKTNGLDITAKYGIPLGELGTLRFIAALNFNKTEITNKDQITTPDQLKAITTTPILGRVEQGRFEEGQPKNTYNLMVNYLLKKWTVMVRAIRFGEVKTFDATDPNKDQLFGAKWYTDLEVSYNFGSGFGLALGTNNIFDVYPDKSLKVNSNSGIIPYSGVSPSGYNGRFIYTRLDYSL